MRSNLFYLSVVLYMVKYSPAYYLGKEKSDEYFTDDDLEQHHERICTQCTENYPNCREEFFKIWGSYDDWWNCPSDGTCSWDLTMHDIAIGCSATSSVQRKKRSRNIGRPGTDSQQTDIQQGSTAEDGQRNKRDSDFNGFLYINNAFHGQNYDMTDKGCDAVMDSERDYCVENALYYTDNLIKCNGQHDCFYLGLPIPNTCGEILYSEFLQVDYQCIPENLVVSVDSYSNLRAPVGYVMSTNYPYVYTPQCSYQCVISHYPKKLIDLELEVLDFHLEPAKENNGCCIYDWLEVQSINNEEQIVERQRFCGQQSQNDLLQVSGNTIRLLFQSDTTKQERGFWIKYSAYDQEGEATNVTIHCSSYDPYNDNQYDLPDTLEFGCSNQETTGRELSTPELTTSKHISNESAEDDDTTTSTTTKRYTTTFPGTTTDDTSTKNYHTTTDDHTTVPNVNDGSDNTDLPQSEEQSSSSSARTIGIAVGAALGGLIVIGVTVAVVVLCCRNSSAKGNISSGPAYNNPYYVQPGPPSKAAVKHAYPSPLATNMGVDNPEYVSQYLTPVSQSQMGSDVNPVDINRDYEEIPASVGSFGVPGSVMDEGSSGGYTKPNGTKEEVNVYQELVP